MSVFRCSLKCCSHSVCTIWIWTESLNHLLQGKSLFISQPVWLCRRALPCAGEIPSSHGSGWFFLLTKDTAVQHSSPYPFSLARSSLPRDKMPHIPISLALVLEWAKKQSPKTYTYMDTHARKHTCTHAHSNAQVDSTDKQIHSETVVKIWPNVLCYSFLQSFLH